MPLIISEGFECFVVDGFLKGETVSQIGERLRMSEVEVCDVIRRRLKGAIKEHRDIDDTLRQIEWEIEPKVGGV